MSYGVTGPKGHNQWLPDREWVIDQKYEYKPSQKNIYRAQAMPEFMLDYFANLREDSYPRSSQFNSCAAGSVSAAIKHWLITNNAPATFTPSILYIHYYARYLRAWEEKPDADTFQGTSINACLRASFRFGICDERRFPITTSATDNIVPKPPDDMGSYALTHFVPIGRAQLKPGEVEIDHLKGALLELNQPFIFGFNLSDDMNYLENAAEDAPVFEPPAEPPSDNHCALAVGWTGKSDEQGYFWVRDVFGTNEEAKGVVRLRKLSYQYFKQLGTHPPAFDFWVIKAISSTSDGSFKDKWDTRKESERAFSSLMGTKLQDQAQLSST